MIAVVIRRRTRALRMSSPNLARARFTGSGNGGVDRMYDHPLTAIILAETSLYEQEINHYIDIKPSAHRDHHHNGYFPGRKMS
jgi:hypothetical protein